MIEGWKERELARVRRLCRKAKDVADLSTREAAYYADSPDTCPVMVRLDLDQWYVGGNVAIVSAKAARWMGTMSTPERRLAVASPQSRC